jgi:hypothetical protein
MRIRPNMVRENWGVPGPSNESKDSLSLGEMQLLLSSTRAPPLKKKKKIKRSWTSFKGGGVFFFAHPQMGRQLIRIES